MTQCSVQGDGDEPNIETLDLNGELSRQQLEAIVEQALQVGDQQPAVCLMQQVEHTERLSVLHP